MPTDGSYSELASLRMQLSWLAHRRLDCMFVISQMSQVTRDIFDEYRRNVFKLVNSTVQYVQEVLVCIRFS